MQQQPTALGRQVQIMNAFMTLSSQVQQLIRTLSRRQHLQEQSVVPGPGVQPQPGLQQPQQQQQLSPSQQHSPLSSRFSTPKLETAAPDVGRSSASDQQCPWSGNVTTNALYVSTPPTCYGRLTSPTQTAEVVTMTSPTTSSYWGDFNPLQSALKGARPPQQQRQRIVRGSTPMQQQKQQPGVALKLLRGLQEEMLQWFVQYMQDGLASSTPACKGECMELLMAVGKAQEWVENQLAASDNGGKSFVASPTAGASCKSPTISSTALSNSSRMMHCATLALGNVKGHAYTAGVGGTGAMQLSQLHKALRRQLTDFGYLQYQLPA